MSQIKPKIKPKIVKKKSVKSRNPKLYAKEIKNDSPTRLAVSLFMVGFIFAAISGAINEVSKQREKRTKNWNGRKQRLSKSKVAAQSSTSKQTKLGKDIEFAAKAAEKFKYREPEKTGGEVGLQKKRAATDKNVNRIGKGKIKSEVRPDVRKNKVNRKKGN